MTYRTIFLLLTTPLFAGHDVVLHELCKQYPISAQSSSKRSSIRRACTLIPPLEHDTSLTYTLIKDLNLFFYSTDNLEQSILAKLYRYGHTLMGKVALARILSAPTTVQTILIDRQKSITYLKTHASLTTTILALTKEFASRETHLYSLFNSRDFLYSHDIESLFYQGNFHAFATPESAQTLEVTRWISDAKLLVMPYISQWTMKWILQTLTEGIDEVRDAETQTTPAYNAMVRIVGAALSWPAIKRQYEQMRYRMKLVSEIRERFQSILVLLNTITAVAALLTNHPQLLTWFPPGNDLVRHYAEHHNEYNVLIRFLSSNAFTSNSYFSAPIGKILFLIPYFLTVKDTLATIIPLLAQCEVLAALATLMASDSETSPWCRTSYDVATTPHLILSGVWFPALEHATQNNITMGGAKRRGIILTGANGTGKSIFIKSCVTAALLSQTIGFAPAQACSITPFARISGCLSAADDLTHGNSLFQAENTRMSHEFSLLSSLSSMQYTLFASDEMFSSTAPHIASELAYGCAAGLGIRETVLPLIATHAPLLTTLATNDSVSYENYKTTDFYSVIPGISELSNAFDLATTHDIPATMLAYALSFSQPKPQ